MPNSYPYDWVVREPSLVTRVGGSRCLVQRLGIQTSQADTSSAVVVSLIDGEVRLNGVAVDLGDDAMAFLSLMDEADAVGVVGTAYLSDPSAC